jgi:23S rRNA pseudouridine2605 synthase
MEGLKMPEKTGKTAMQARRPAKKRPAGKFSSSRPHQTAKSPHPAKKIADSRGERIPKTKKAADQHGERIPKTKKAADQHGERIQKTKKTSGQRGERIQKTKKAADQHGERFPKAKKNAEQHGERIQKVLAAAGLGSRRQCEELITTGRVEVDRKVITELGSRVDSDVQEIRVDGQPLPKTKLVYYAVNKPAGIVCTNSDPTGRPRVIDMIPNSADIRLFTIGRLDLSSEGLILVTNDGELANLLTHPRYGVDKTYRALVAGRPNREVLSKLLRGVHLAEGVARVDRVEVKSHHKESTNLEIVLREGKNREIRRILAQLGHKVMRLTRVAVGPIRLGEMPVGSVRKLAKEEISTLRKSVVQP